MAIALPDARPLSDEVLEALRLRALRGCERGLTESTVADVLGVARETVSRWWSAYVSGGVEALPQERTGRPEGSGRTLTDEQGVHIQKLIDENSPEKLGIASPLWNRRAVRDLIKKEYGIDMAERTVGEYLNRWGYTAKRPRRHSKEQNPQEVREWLEETYPAIERRAAAEHATILWCDEVGCAADENPGRGYARKGEPATKEVPNHHIRVNEISAINNEGDVHFMTYTTTMTAPLFIVFLDRLLSETKQKIFLIVDGLRAHDAKIVEEWVEKREERIELFHLPAYTPERNVDEYLNNDLKSNVNAESLPDTKETLRSHIQTFMWKLCSLPEHVRSYFQHPCAQYAAAP
jgi:transposase